MQAKYKGNTTAGLVKGKNYSFVRIVNHPISEYGHDFSVESEKLFLKPEPGVMIAVDKSTVDFIELETEPQGFNDPKKEAKNATNPGA
jgi:hypothetical protein